MAKTSTLTLGGTGNLEITRDPIADNVMELIPKDQIVQVAGVFQSKNSNINLVYSAPSSPLTGTNVIGVTSGETATIGAMTGTSKVVLEGASGDFTIGETLIIDEDVTGVGVAAAPGTWNGVSGATSGVGVGATFNVTDVGGTYETIAIANPGLGYLPGDTVTILGTDLGGASPANDLVITITGETIVVDSYEPVLTDDYWQYPYETMTVLQIEKADGSRLNIELQDVSNQGTWNTGTLVALQTAIAAINAWL